MAKDDKFTQDCVDGAPLIKAIKVTEAQSELLVNAFLRVAVVQKKLEALDYATSGRHTHRDSDAVGNAHTVLSGALYTELAYAYKDLFMWGNLFPEVRTYVADYVESHYVEGNYEIMHFLDPNGISPGVHRTCDEETLRDTIKAALERARDENKDTE